jgi:hypothetical protein
MLLTFSLSEHLKATTFGFLKRIIKHMNQHAEFLRRCLDILIMSRDYEMLKKGGYSLLPAGNNEDILKLKIGGT